MLKKINSFLILLYLFAAPLFSHDADLSRAAPVYDIQRYRNEILKGPIDRLVLGEIVFVQAEPVREPVSYRIIFNIVVSVISTLLAALIIFKLKK